MRRLGLDFMGACRNVQPHRHDDAEAAGGVTADAGAEFIAKAEGGADFQCVCQIACVERDHRGTPVDFHRHGDRGTVAVAVAVGQCEPSGVGAGAGFQSSRTDSFESFVDPNPQPGDHARAAVVRDDRDLPGMSRDDLPVVRVVAGNRAGHQQVPASSEMRCVGIPGLSAPTGSR